MKSTLFTILLLIISQSAIAQVFTIDDKGIVKCPTAKVGDKGTIFGVTYEAVDDNLLRQRRDQGADLTGVCTSLVTNMSRLFEGKSFNQAIGNWDVNNVTDMSYMFYGTPFNQPIENWDVSKVTSMSWMFSGTPFNQPIGNWDVSMVINMEGIFSATAFNQPIGNWNVSRVTNMNHMFEATPFNQDIGNWNLSSTTNTSYMFWYARKFNQIIENWNVGSVTDMRSMFGGATDFNQPIGKWDVSHVTNMSGMFGESSFNQNISNWNVSKVEDFSYMFHISKFNQPIGNWNTAKGSSMRGMFDNSLYNHTLDKWNVGNVNDMVSMFKNSSFNQPIGDWNVSKVTDMSEMFESSPFNQTINLWCVPNINSEPSRFSINSPLTSQNKPVWGTCPGLPSIASLSTPQNNATNQSNRPSFVWSSITNATRYQLQVFEGTDPVVLDTLIQGTQLSMTKALKTGSVHNWRVRGINDARKLTGEWSPIWTFTTLSIPTPSLLAPANNATGLSGNVTLNWSPTANTPDYQLQVSASNMFASFVLNSNVSAPPFSLAAFQHGDPANFYWRVRSNSEFGPGAWSPTWTFTRAKLTSNGDEAEVPAEFTLSQNFPNPFNPTTKISFTLPRSATVRLEVFNSLGQPVSVIAEGQLPAGAHTYAFDGAALSSGVYLYRLTTPDFAKTRAMVFLK